MIVAFTISFLCICVVLAVLYSMSCSSACEELRLRLDKEQAKSPPTPEQLAAEAEVAKANMAANKARHEALIAGGPMRKAEAEAQKAEAEAQKAKAEAQSAEAEAQKAVAENVKREAEKAEKEEGRGWVTIWRCAYRNTAGNAIAVIEQNIQTSEKRGWWCNLVCSSKRKYDEVEKLFGIPHMDSLKAKVIETSMPSLLTTKGPSDIPEVEIADHPSMHPLWEDHDHL